jgi:hypothetical protein
MTTPRHDSRTSSWLRAALIGICGVILWLPGAASAAGFSHPNRFTSPKSLVLSLHDVSAAFGTSFRQAGAAVVSNAAVATAESVTIATINRIGRITGYETSFFARAGAGVLTLDDYVGAYRSVAGAHWQYAKYISQNRPPAHAKRIPLSVSGIGNEARGYIFTTSVAGNEVGSIYFRRGKYTARIDLFTVGSVRVHAADFSRLAQVLDQRMRGAT